MPFPDMVLMQNEKKKLNKRNTHNASEVNTKIVLEKNSRSEPLRWRRGCVTRTAAVLQNSRPGVNELDARLEVLALKVAGGGVDPKISRVAKHVLTPLPNMTSLIPQDQLASTTAHEHCIHFDLASSGWHYRTRSVVL